MLRTAFHGTEIPGQDYLAAFWQKIDILAKSVTLNAFDRAISARRDSCFVMGLT